ncbi:MAG: hypothetical protein KDD44_09515, partial [Bdellovibrionales bacterium]|nr:hypothetical protein [Bdellovibrionales bacterium]
EVTISISHHRRWRLRYESLIKPLPLAFGNAIEAANRPHSRTPRRTRRDHLLHHQWFPSRAM